MSPAIYGDTYAAQEQLLDVYLKNNVSTAMPVVVKKVHSPFIDVAPVVQSVKTDGTAIPITDNDIIHNIPVLMPSARAGAVNIKWPVAVGDYGLLIACAIDITKFKNSRAVSPTQSSRRYKWSDGFFLPLDFGGFSGDFEFNGDAKWSGDIEQTGNLKVSGDLTAGTISGDIKSITTGGAPTFNGIIKDANGTLHTVINGIITA